MASTGSLEEDPTVELHSQLAGEYERKHLAAHGFVSIASRRKEAESVLWVEYCFDGPRMG